MKTRYLVFAGDDYYPIGGAKDFIGEFVGPGEAALGMPRNRDWAHVAELSRYGLVVVAELREGNLEVYPERMAHQRIGGAESGRPGDPELPVGGRKSKEGYPCEHFSAAT